MRPKWHLKVDTGLSAYQKGNTIMTRNVAILIFDEVEQEVRQSDAAVIVR